MKKLLIIACATVALAGCGNRNQSAGESDSRINQPAGANSRLGNSADVQKGASGANSNATGALDNLSTPATGSGAAGGRGTAGSSGSGTATDSNQTNQ